MASLPTPNDVDAVTCPVCLEIFDKPTKITCGHVFCQPCLQPMLQVAEPSCPMCRMTFIPSAAQAAIDMDLKIRTGRGTCPGCSRQFPFMRLRTHSISCSRLKVSHKFQPVARSSQQATQNLPNRSTFKCPICGMKNLDTSGLVKHCTEQHGNTSVQVVCPVCASMPWGDRSQVSANFIQHLTVRHKFEYDTYVDYQQDDDAMLRAALQASLQEH